MDQPPKNSLTSILISWLCQHRWAMMLYERYRNRGVDFPDHEQDPSMLASTARRHTVLISTTATLAAGVLAVVGIANLKGSGLNHWLTANYEKESIESPGDNSVLLEASFDRLTETIDNDLPIPIRLQLLDEQITLAKKIYAADSNQSKKAAAERCLLNFGLEAYRIHQIHNVPQIIKLNDILRISSKAKFHSDIEIRKLAFLNVAYLRACILRNASPDAQPFQSKNTKKACVELTELAPDDIELHRKYISLVEELQFQDYEAGVTPNLIAPVVAGFMSNSNEEVLMLAYRLEKAAAGKFQRPLNTAR